MFREQRVRSELLGGDLRVLISEADDAARHPVVYLLHGRGDRAEDWLPALEDLDVAASFVILDAPWRRRASYYVDSPALPVESAIVTELIPAMEATLDAEPGRMHRVIAGYSMGGAGALRIGLGHPELFATVIAMSPAVYVPDPPEGSSARESGAYGTGETLFDIVRYRSLNYPELLERFPVDASLRLAVAIGDDEPPHPGAPERLSMRSQATELVRRAELSPGIEVTFATYEGGHDFRVWSPALRDALASAQPNKDSSAGGAEAGLN